MPKDTAFQGEDIKEKLEFTKLEGRVVLDQELSDRLVLDAVKGTNDPRFFSVIEYQISKTLLNSSLKKIDENDYKNLNEKWLFVLAKAQPLDPKLLNYIQINLLNNALVKRSFWAAAFGDRKLEQRLISEFKQELDCSKRVRIADKLAKISTPDSIKAIASELFNRCPVGASDLAYELRLILYQSFPELAYLSQNYLPRNGEDPMLKAAKYFKEKFEINQIYEYVAPKKTPNKFWLENEEIK